MADQIKVLFICSANACRSQMAEALLRHLDPTRFEAFSAGTHPAGYIHPLAVAALEKLNVPIGDQYSKSWDDFEDQPMDLIITVCSAAADETCPIWPGTPLTANWPIDDPVSIFGPESQRLDFAARGALRIKAMLERLVALDFDKLPRQELVKRIREIGRA